METARSASPRVGWLLAHYAANFLFWFLFMNMTNLYDYVPMRVFAADGDVHHFVLGGRVDPWVIYVMGGYLVLWAMVAFYRTWLPLGLALSDFVRPVARRDVCGGDSTPVWLFLHPFGALQARHGLVTDRAHLGDGDSAGAAPDVGPHRGRTSGTAAGALNPHPIRTKTIDSGMA